MKLTKILNESKTPRGHIGEAEKLTKKAEKQLEDLIKTVRDLKEHANQGVWYFSGQMKNDYGIEKVEDVKDLYQDLKSQVGDNLLISFREINKYMSLVRNKIDALKKVKIK